MEHGTVRGAESLSFWEAIQNEAQRIRPRLSYEHRAYSYVERGFYMAQLERLWSLFGKDGVLVLSQEKLKADPQTVLRAVTEFLGVSPFKQFSSKNVHAIPYLAPMTPTERNHLRGIFREEIHRLEKVLGWDCAHWLAD